MMIKTTKQHRAGSHRRLADYVITVGRVEMNLFYRYKGVGCVSINCMIKSISSSGARVRRNWIFRIGSTGRGLSFCTH